MDPHFSTSMRWPRSNSLAPLGERDSLSFKLAQYTTELKRTGLHRRRQLTALGDGAIHFSRNDYLSLTSHPRIIRAFQSGFERYPTSSGGSMVVCGYHERHQALEQAFADSLGVDDCILFSSGYAANVSVINLLAQLNVHVLVDKMVHASIYDGLKASGASFTRYLHNHLPDLTIKINYAPEDTVLMTEGIFSMSGQCAPLNEIAKLGKDTLKGLIVDEAHAFGLIGDQGMGAVSQHQLTQDEVPLRIIPLGKAFAATGAVVAGQHRWIDALLQSARPYIYSTAFSPAVAHGLLETLEVIKAADEQRTKLCELVGYFREAIKNSPLKWRDSHTPVQQLQLGCPERALYFAKRLREQSIICVPMRQPTVTKQETGLRVILNAHHQSEHIDHLFRCLHQL